jgi:hypothetical protein
MTLKRVLTKPQAQKITDELRRDFLSFKKQCRGGWATLARRAAKAVDAGVPLLLGMNMHPWLERVFEESAANAYDSLKRYSELKEIPVKTLDEMSPGNAKQLMRLPAKHRTQKVIDQAVDLKPKEFKPIVDGIRKTKMGIKPEQWGTFAVRLPNPVLELVHAAHDKLAGVLQLDIKTDSERPKNMITVVEAWANLVVLTDESRLKLEIEGSEQ